MCRLASSEPSSIEEERPTRAIAIEIGGQIVGDTDQPWAQRPPVRLALGALEMTVGLQEGLLGEVLRVVMVADPIVGVAVDVAQMSAIQLGELGVELRLGLLFVGEPLIAPYPPTLSPKSSGGARATSGAARWDLRIGDRSGAAKPLPLQADTSPDTLGHTKGHRRRWPLGLREAKWTPTAEADLARDVFASLDARPRCPAQPPERRAPQFAEQAVRPLDEDGASGPGRTRVPSGKITTQSPRCENCPSGGHRLFVAACHDRPEKPQGC